MSRKLQIKRGPAVNLPVLAEAEFGLVTDEKKLYIGHTSGNIRVATAADIDNVMLVGTIDPTTSTTGLLGQLYKNTASGDIFVCIKITNSTDYSWRILPTGMELGISLLNGWVNADGGIPIAFVRTGNVCHIYGMVSGGVQTGNTIICKIPQTLKGYYSLFARVSDGSVVGLTATGYDLKIVSSGWNIGANLVYIDIVYNCTKEV